MNTFVTLVALLVVTIASVSGVSVRGINDDTDDERSFALKTLRIGGNKLGIGYYPGGQQEVSLTQEQSDILKAITIQIKDAVVDFIDKISSESQSIRRAAENEKFKNHMNSLSKESCNTLRQAGFTKLQLLETFEKNLGFALTRLEIAEKEFLDEEEISELKDEKFEAAKFDQFTSMLIDIVFEKLPSNSQIYLDITEVNGITLGELIMDDVRLFSAQGKQDSVNQLINSLDALRNDIGSIELGP